MKKPITIVYSEPESYFSPKALKHFKDLQKEPTEKEPTEDKTAAQKPAKKTENKK